MLRVIKFDVEVFIKPIGKCFPRRVAAVDVLVTDRTHRNVGRRKLSEMTAGAGFVARKAWAGRIIGAPMTVVTAQRRMLGAGV